MPLMNICVIGNSHIGSLKRGWDLLDDPVKSRAHATFFGHRAHRLEGLNVQSDRLVPSNDDLRDSLRFTSGGQDAIDPAAYDLVILYGMSARYWLASKDHAYSAAAMERAACDVSEKTLSMSILRKLRRITKRKIYVGHDPLPAIEGGVHLDPADYRNGLRELNRLIYEPMQAEILTQPETTIVNGRYTAIEHSVGSRRLAVGGDRMDDIHEYHDRTHMNDDFGRLWWIGFLDAVATRP